MTDTSGSSESYYSGQDQPCDLSVSHDAGSSAPLPFPRPGDSNCCNWSIGDVVVVFALGGFLAVVLMIPEYANVTQRLNSLTTPSVSSVARMIMIQNMCLFLVCFLWLKLWRRADVRSLGLVARGWRESALIGLKVGCCLWVVGEAVQVVTRVLIRALVGERTFAWLNSFQSSTTMLQQAMASVTPVSAIALFVLVGIVAPFAEEVMFRGFAYPAFRHRLGLKWGLVANAAFFAFLHFSPLDFPALCAIGIVLAWMYQVTQTLMTPFAAHAANNVITLGIMYLWPNSWL